ncbi:DsbA family oxidoreductase [Halorubrum halodurans]|uniref:Disulfide bond formation protein DsbA n=1 Tax=Halorubrum halodurans TaxID=1383851 RepID=A0A256ID41_9EURY|nr:DsbA family oxidoreductase [Halorubrum halodurans]OYR54475.1 disulfide bond formation protein DsbA [Halorubrum halodurans]
MTDTDPVAVTVFSDYVCPFCYLGRQSLERYRETRDGDAPPLRIDWHPFDLRSGKRRPDGSIDTDADDGKDEDYYEQAKENVRRLQAEYDVEMDLEIATDVDSLDAQVVSYHLKRHHPYETWLAFDEGVFAALWRDGEDIGDRDRLVSLAETAGVDPDEARSALADDTLRGEVTELFEAAKRRGVTGVPTFAYDGHAARGAVPPEHLRRLVEGA